MVIAPHSGGLLLLFILCSIALMTAAGAPVASFRHYRATFHLRRHVHDAKKACDTYISPLAWHLSVQQPLRQHETDVILFATPQAVDRCMDTLRHEPFRPLGAGFTEPQVASKLDERALTVLLPSDVHPDLLPSTRLHISGRQLLSLTLSLSCVDHEALLNLNEEIIAPLEEMLRVLSVDDHVALPGDLSGSAYGHVHLSARPTAKAHCRRGTALVTLPLEILGSEHSERIPPRLLASIAAMPRVRWVEPTPKFTSLNRIATKTLQSELPTVDRPLWHHGITGAGQIVAVGDTGLDWDSCFFDDPGQHVAFWPNTNYRHRKLVSYVPCVTESGDVDTMDAVGAHGTHVAGSVAGSAVYYPGVSTATASMVSADGQYNGLAKDAKLFFYDLTCGNNVQNQDMVPPGDLYDFYEPGHQAGARISSNSWGDGEAPKTYNAVLRRTDEFAFDFPDQLIVFAAGNNPTQGVLSPAAAKSVLTVGAHPNAEIASNRDSVCSFSARGPTFDNRVKPDVLAPGKSITSAYSDGNHQSHQCGTFSLFGTSMACPLVAGAAALVRQYLMQSDADIGRPPFNNTAPLSSTLRAMLIQSAHFISPGEFRPNGDEGWGRIEPHTVIFVSNDTTTVPPRLHVFEDRVGLAHHQSRTWCVKPSSIPLQITLAWTDPPLAAEGSAFSVVNDLDLAVVNTVSGLLYRGNGDASAFDAHNVVEKVIVNDRAEDKYFTITVFAAHVEPQTDAHTRPAHTSYVVPYNGTQPYSLVITGGALEAHDGNCSSFLKVPSTGPRCPTSPHGACSGAGVCVDGVCVCGHGRYGVDCGRCDAELMCHGNGVCSVSPSGALTCHCAPAVTVSPTCDTCVTGRYGPHCASDCVCVHGHCNETSGQCICDRGLSTGYWSGDHCERCAFDYIRVPVDESGAPVADVPKCVTSASWCIDRELRHIHVDRGARAFITINDNPTYDNSMTCEWMVHSTSAYHGLHFRFSTFDVEKPYDEVDISKVAADGVTKTRLQTVTGNALPAPVAVGPGESLQISFKSDYLGNNFAGILGVAWVIDSCVDEQCHGHGHCVAGETRCLCDADWDPATDCFTEFTSVPSTASTLPPPVATTTTMAPVPQQQTTPTVPVAVDPPPESRPCDCHGHGTCTTAGQCTCAPPFTGPTCDQVCPTVGSGTPPCSGLGNCTSAGACDCPPNVYGVACQVDEVLVLDATNPTTRLIAAASQPWVFAQYRTSTLPFPATQLVRTDIVITELTLCVERNTTVAVWNDAAHAGIVERALYQSTHQSPPTDSVVLRVWGWNRDDSRSTTLGLQTQGEAPVCAPLIAVRELIESPQWINDCVAGVVCKIETYPRTQDTTPAAPNVSSVAVVEGYDIFRDRQAAFFAFAGLVVAFFTVLGLGLLYREVSARRRRYAALHADDVGTAGPRPRRVLGNDDVEMVEAGPSLSISSDEEADLQVHPAVASGVVHEGQTLNQH